MFQTDRSGRGEPFFGSAVMARGYAIHHLKNACVIWGALAFLCLLTGAGIFFAGLWKTYAPASYLAVVSVFLISVYMGGRALRDLTGQPVSFEGRVAGRHASLFWYKLFFLEDRYYLRVERGDDRRPLTYGTGVDLAEGWFLAGKGYHDILAGGDRVRGTVYRRTRLIASLVKV